MFGGAGILPVIQHIPSGGHLDPQEAEKDQHGPLRDMTPKKHGVRSFNLHVPSFPSPIFLLLRSDKNWGWRDPLSGGHWAPGWARCASDPRKKQGTVQLSVCSQALSLQEAPFPYGLSNV